MDTNHRLWIIAAVTLAAQSARAQEVTEEPSEPPVAEAVGTGTAVAEEPVVNATPPPTPPPAPAKPPEPAAVAVAPEPVEAQPEGNWSAGVGFGMQSFTDGLRDLIFELGVPVSSVYAARVPEFQMVLERRVGDNTFLMLQGGATYSRDSDDDDAVWATTETVSLGIRWVANPGGIVEVSPYVIGGLGFSMLSAGLTDGKSYTLGLGAGFAVERKLLDGLYLRFSTLVARMTYVTSTLDYSYSDPFDSYSDENSSSRILAGLDFKPSLQLRMVF